MASFQHQATGIAVTRDGRIFVSFPRWSEDSPISVGELKDGKVTPYPDAAWNGFRDVAPTDPAQSFVCVQSVTCDTQGNLWVLDPAAPGLAFEVTGGPKLVRIDLATNRVARVYAFDPAVAPQGSYLNDIRFTPDGKRAVLTNSGAPGCLLTFDVETGETRRVLVGHPSTQFEHGLVVSVNGKPLKRLDGETAHFSADGIAVDNRGEYAMWQATTGTTMYRAPIGALFDGQMTPDQLGATVQTVARTFLADGYWMARDGVLYLTSCADNSVKRMMGNKTFEVAVRDSRLLWPDSMAEGADGSIYVTASHIPEMRAWQGPGVQQTQLFRFKPA